MKLRGLLVMVASITAASLSVTACTGSSDDDDDDGFSTPTPTPTGTGTPTPAPTATPPPNPFSNAVGWTLGGVETWLKLDTNFDGNVIAWRVVDEVGFSCESFIQTTGFPTSGRGVRAGDNITLPWSIPDNDYSVPGCTPGNVRFDVDYNVNGIPDEYFEESFLVQSAPSVTDAAFAGQTNIASNVHGFKGTTHHLRLEMNLTEAITLEFVEFYDVSGNLVFGCDNIRDNAELPFTYPLFINSGYQIVDVCAAAAPVVSPFQFDLSLWGFSGDGTTFFQYISNMTYDSSGSPTFN